MTGIDFARSEANLSIKVLTTIFEVKMLRAEWNGANSCIKLVELQWPKSLESASSFHIQLFENSKFSGLFHLNY